MVCVYPKASQSSAECVSPVNRDKTDGNARDDSVRRACVPRRADAEAGAEAAAAAVRGTSGTSG